MLNKTDPKIFELISKEEQRQQETISLIPSESEMYPEKRELMGCFKSKIKITKGVVTIEK